MTEPPGLKNSHLAQISTPGVSRSNECSRTIGVSPMRSVICSATRIRARRMTSASLIIELPDLLRERLAAVERQAQVADRAAWAGPRSARTSTLQRLRRGQRPGEHRGRAVVGRRPAAANGASAVASGAGARRANATMSTPSARAPARR